MPWAAKGHDIEFKYTENKFVCLRDNATQFKYRVSVDCCMQCSAFTYQGSFCLSFKVCTDLTGNQAPCSRKILKRSSAILQSSTWGDRW